MDKGQTRKQVMIRMHPVEGRRMVLGISPLEDSRQDCSRGDRARYSNVEFMDERSKQGSIWKEILRTNEHCQAIYYFTGVLKQIQWGCPPLRVKMRGRIKREVCTRQVSWSYDRCSMAM